MSFPLRTGLCLGLSACLTALVILLTKYNGLSLPFWLGPAVMLHEGHGHYRTLAILAIVLVPCVPLPLIAGRPVAAIGSLLIAGVAFVAWAITTLEVMRILAA